MPEYDQDVQGEVRQPMGSQGNPFPVGNTLQTLDTMQWRADQSDILERIEHKLRGEKKVHSSWVKAGRASANEFGIAEIMQILETYVNKDVIYSNLTIEQIHQICLALNHELAFYLPRRWREFGIDPFKVGLLITMMMDIVYITLQRPKNNGERELSKSIDSYQGGPTRMIPQSERIEG